MDSLKLSVQPIDFCFDPISTGIESPIPSKSRSQSPSGATGKRSRKGVRKGITLPPVGKKVAKDDDKGKKQRTFSKLHPPLPISLPPRVYTPATYKYYDKKWGTDYKGHKTQDIDDDTTGLSSNRENLDDPNQAEDDENESNHDDDEAEEDGFSDSDDRSESHGHDKKKDEESVQWYSKAGKALKSTFPELARAAILSKEVEAKEKKAVARMEKLKPVPFEARFLSVNEWKHEVNNVQVHNSFLKLMNYVILREEALLRVYGLAGYLDELYWKYASNYKNRVDLDKSLTSEAFIEMQVRLGTFQEQFSVAIAHYRAISLCVIEALLKWRRLYGLAQTMTLTPSIYWKNENYLTKMTKDLKDLWNIQVIRMWLGFEPNPFMLPPLNHDPRYNRELREQKRLAWKTKTNAFIERQLTRIVTMTTNASEGGSITITARRNPGYTSQKNSLVATTGGRDQDNISISNMSKLGSSDSLPILPRASLRPNIPATDMVGSKSAAALEVVYEDGAMKAKKKKPIVDAGESASCLLSEDVSEADDSDEKSRVTKSEEESTFESSVADSSTTTLIEIAEEWKELRNQCLHSWETPDDPNAAGFWENLDLNARVLEAAVGLPEVFPKIYLVPPLPDGLRGHCEHIESIVARELYQLEEINKRKQESQNLKSQVLASNNLEGVIASIESQEGFTKYIEIAISLIDRQQRIPPRPRSPSPHHLNPTADDINPADVEVKAGANNVSIFITNVDNQLVKVDQSSDYQARLTENTPQHHYFRLEIDHGKLEAQIAAKVDKDRSKTERIDGSLVLCKHVTLQQTSEFKQKSKSPIQAAIRIQARIRGILARARLRNQLQSAKRWKDIIRVQKYARIWVAKKVLREKKRQFRLETFVLRRMVLRKNQSANIIIKLIRRCAAMNRQRRFMKKYDVATLQAKDPVKLSKILAAIIRIQRVWRGYHGRKRVKRMKRAFTRQRSAEYTMSRSYAEMRRHSTIGSRLSSPKSPPGSHGGGKYSFGLRPFGGSESSEPGDDQSSHHPSLHRKKSITLGKIIPQETSEFSRANMLKAASQHNRTFISDLPPKHTKSKQKMKSTNDFYKSPYLHMKKSQSEASLQKQRRSSVLTDEDKDLKDVLSTLLLT